MARNLSAARTGTSRHDDATDVRDTIEGDTIEGGSFDSAPIDLRERPRAMVAAGRAEVATSASRFVVDWAPPDH